MTTSRTPLLLIGIVILVGLLSLDCISALEAEHIPFAHGEGGHETTHWAVKLKDGSTAEEVARAHGFSVWGHIVNDIYLFHEVASELPNKPHIETHPNVHWAKKQIAKRRYKRSVNDPMFPSQWNLKRMNVEAAWNQGYKGFNVTVAIVDDGLERTHPEFDSKYSASSSYDFNYNDADPTPFNYDPHGTESGGAAVAKANNSNCGVGIAPEAGISGIRLIADYTTDAMEAAALSYQIQTNDIFSCSWGPQDDGLRLEAPDSILLQAMENAVHVGRQGKGTIYVWAAGNGLERKDSCAFDGYASNKYAIIIGSVNYDNTEAYYSEKCAGVMGVIPSSGSNGYAITTCALKSSCVSSFGGTSAACPQGAGLIALMLNARPELSWRDVQAVIAKAGVVVDPTSSDWFVNGGGYKHSPKYGFGLLTADSLIAAAKVHTLLPHYLSFVINAENVDSAAIHSTSGSVFSISVPSNLAEGEGEFVLEHLEVNIDLTCKTRGQVTLILTSPFGTEAVLQEVHSDYNPDIQWTFTSKRTFGELAAGTWTLLVLPGSQPNTNNVQLHSWSLGLFGHAS